MSGPSMQREFLRKLAEHSFSKGFFCALSGQKRPYFDQKIKSPEQHFFIDRKSGKYYIVSYNNYITYSEYSFISYITNIIQRMIGKFCLQFPSLQSSIWCCAPLCCKFCMKVRYPHDACWRLDLTCPIASLHSLTDSLLFHTSWKVIL